MVTDAIINTLLFVPYKILSSLNLPTIDFALPDNVFDGILQFIQTVAYIMPVKGLLVWVTFTILLDNFRIIWAFILRVKSFIPTMGR